MGLILVVETLHRGGGGVEGCGGGGGGEHGRDGGRGGSSCHALPQDASLVSIHDNCFFKDRRLNIFISIGLSLCLYLYIFVTLANSREKHTWVKLLELWREGMKCKVKRSSSQGDLPKTALL